MKEKKMSVDQIRKILVNRRQTLLGNIQTEDIRRKSRMRIHDDDIYAFAQNVAEEAVSDGITMIEGMELNSIDNAIKKIDAGEYGLCEDCGSKIKSARLRAMPFAVRCLRCQEKAEREDTLLC